MAPPSSGMRPSRYLVVLAAIFVVLYGILLGTGGGTLVSRLTPKLGIDLAGGTSMVLQARTKDGNPPDSARMEQARTIIERRVNAQGVSEAEVFVQGSDKIAVSVPGGANSDSLRQVGTTAEMRFRKVLAAIIDTGVPAPTASATPDPSASAEATATTPAPAAGDGASPTATAAPTPSVRNTALPTLDEVKAKLGPAYDVAAGIDASAVAQGTTTVSSDTALVAQLEPFRNLTPEEVAALPYYVQFVVPQIGCDKLDARPVGSMLDPAVRGVACYQSYKYLLDVAKVLGEDLSDAQANIDTSVGLGEWKVDLTFKDNGSKWEAVTREAFNNQGVTWGTGAGDTGIPVTGTDPQAGPQCLANAQQTSTSGTGQVCMVAVVLDNEVVTSPAIQAVLSSTSQITGSFDKSSAQTLADQLKYGALPVSFEVADLYTVSPTLGADYLRYGLIAAGIGMALVVIYAFFYYRLLGSVIVLSLVLSALLTFGMLVELGRGIGFALSLAGIAGFIVSLGVAADSFVIYFERLKDEIREGKHPRLAVNRAWTRARRTIITANAVTIMAAIVLYLVGSSQVQGFAFALGLATLLDLVIVFLFRHPMMTLLARTPAFLSPRVSGLGRVLQHRTKEA